MEEKKTVKLDPNRHQGKTFDDIQQETLKSVSDTISSDKNLKDRNVEFKVEKNKAGDLEYHRYEDDNPNDANPAKLTGIFTQDEMDKAIQSRQEDSFYSYDKQKPITPSISDDEPDTTLAPPTVTKGSGASLYVVINGQITTITI